MTRTGLIYLNLLKTDVDLYNFEGKTEKLFTSDDA